MQDKKRFGLPDEIFRYKDGEQDIVDEQRQVTIVKKVVFDKGIFIYLDGAHYPQKGIATPEILFAFNLVKKHIIEPIKFLNKWYFYPGILIMAFNINNILKIFNDMTWRYVRPHTLKSEFMTSATREFEWLLYVFLKKIGVSEENAEQFSITIASSIEFDNAYRLRFIDMWSEADKIRMIKNPRKELIELTKVMLDRSVGDNSAQKKFYMIAKLFSMILIIPKYKKAFIESFKEIDLEKMRADKVDKYWMTLRKEGYNYMGLTDSERVEYRKRHNLKKPKLINR